MARWATDLVTTSVGHVAELDQRQRLRAADAAGAPRLPGSDKFTAGRARRVLLQGDFLFAAENALNARPLPVEAGG